MLYCSSQFDRDYQDDCLRQDAIGWHMGFTHMGAGFRRDRLYGQRFITTACLPVPLIEQNDPLANYDQSDLGWAVPLGLASVEREIHLAELPDNLMVSEEQIQQLVSMPDHWEATNLNGLFLWSYKGES